MPREISLKPNDKRRLDALRRKAKRHGMRLTKSRRSTHPGGLMLILNGENRVLEGPDFDLDLEMAAYWIERYAKEFGGRPAE